MDIASALVAQGNRPTKTNFLKSPAAERGQIIALALVDRTVLIPWRDGSTDQWTQHNVAEKLYKAAYEGTAWIFPAFTVRGQSEPTENKSDVVFGFKAQGEPVSMTEVYTLTLKDSLYEVDFFNSLRSEMSGDCHAFLFTQNGVFAYIDEDVDFFDVLPIQMDGNATSRITGSMKLSVSQETVGNKGSRALLMGKRFDQKLARAPQLTLATAAPSAGWTLDACSTNVPRLATGTAAAVRTWQFSVVQTGVACLGWKLYQQNSDGEFVSPPAGYTISSAGLVTGPAGAITAGITKLAAVAYLPNGVLGQKNFEVVVA